ncbi:hypothetical protein SK128_021204, partial [Halocaridina rubra]
MSSVPCTTILPIPPTVDTTVTPAPINQAPLPEVTVCDEQAYPQHQLDGEAIKE